MSLGKKKGNMEDPTELHNSNTFICCLSLRQLLTNYVEKY
jgi:hypothetical protein